MRATGTVDLCGRVLIQDAFCPVHDRLACVCGWRDLTGEARACPSCGQPFGVHRDVNSYKRKPQP